MANGEELLGPNQPQEPTAAEAGLDALVSSIDNEASQPVGFISPYRDDVSPTGPPIETDSYSPQPFAAWDTVDTKLQRDIEASFEENSLSELTASAFSGGFTDKAIDFYKDEGLFKDFEADPDFRWTPESFANFVRLIPDDYNDRILGAKSLEEAIHLRNETKKEIDNFVTLGKYGATGMVARFGATMFDPAFIAAMVATRGLAVASVGRPLASLLKGGKAVRDGAKAGKVAAERYGLSVAEKLGKNTKIPREDAFRFATNAETIAMNAHNKAAYDVMMKPHLVEQAFYGGTSLAGGVAAHSLVEDQIDGEDIAHSFIFGSVLGVVVPRIKPLWNKWRRKGVSTTEKLDPNFDHLPKALPSGRRIDPPTPKNNSPFYDPFVIEGGHATFNLPAPNPNVVVPPPRVLIPPLTATSTPTSNALYLVDGAGNATLTTRDTLDPRNVLASWHYLKSLDPTLSVKKALARAGRHGVSKDEIKVLTEMDKMSGTFSEMATVQDLVNNFNVPLMRVSSTELEKVVGIEAPPSLEDIKGFFHGTRVKQFDTFEADPSSSSTVDSAGFGFHFADNPLLAERAAQKHQAFNTKLDTARVLEAEVGGKNFLEITEQTNGWSTEKLLFDLLDNQHITQKEFDLYVDKLDNLDYPTRAEETSLVKELADSKGWSGFKYINTFDASFPLTSDILQGIEKTGAFRGRKFKDQADFTEWLEKQNLQPNLSYIVLDAKAISIKEQDVLTRLKTEAPTTTLGLTNQRTINFDLNNKTHMKMHVGEESDASFKSLGKSLTVHNIETFDIAGSPLEKSWVDYAVMTAINDAVSMGYKSIRFVNNAERVSRFGGAKDNDLWNVKIPRAIAKYGRNKEVRVVKSTHKENGSSWGVRLDSFDIQRVKESNNMVVSPYKTARNIYKNPDSKFGFIQEKIASMVPKEYLDDLAYFSEAAEAAEERAFLMKVFSDLEITPELGMSTLRSMGDAIGVKGASKAILVERIKAVVKAEGPQPPSSIVKYNDGGQMLIPIDYSKFVPAVINNPAFELVADNPYKAEVEVPFEFRKTSTIISPKYHGGETNIVLDFKTTVDKALFMIEAEPRSKEAAIKYLEEVGIKNPEALAVRLRGAVKAEVAENPSSYKPSTSSKVEDDALLIDTKVLINKHGIKPEAVEGGGGEPPVEPPMEGTAPTPEEPSMPQYDPIDPEVALEVLREITPIAGMAGARDVMGPFQSFTNKLTNADAPVVLRAMGDKFIQTSIAPTKGGETVPVTIAVDHRAESFFNVDMSQLAIDIVPAWLAWKAETAHAYRMRRTLEKQPEIDFFSAVGQVRHGITPSISSPHVVVVAEGFKKLAKSLAEKLNEVGLTDGVLPHENYLTREWLPSLVGSGVKNYGIDVMTRLWGLAISRPNVNFTAREVSLMATSMVKNIHRRHIDPDYKSTGGVGESSLEFYQRNLENVEGITKEEVSRIMKKLGKGSKKENFLRKRMELDMTVSITAKNKTTGATDVLKISDFMNTNAMELVARQSRKIHGLAESRLKFNELAEVYNMDPKDMGFDFMRQRLIDELIARGNPADESLELFDHLTRIALGIPIDPAITKLGEVARLFQQMTLAVFGGSFGIAALAEIGQPAAHTGLGALMRVSPDFKKFWKAAWSGKLDDPTIREMQLLSGYLRTYIAGTANANREHEFIMGAVTNADSWISRTTRMAETVAEFGLKHGLLIPIDSFTRILAGATFKDQIINSALKGELGFSEIYAAQMGLETDMVWRIAQMMKQHSELVDVEGGVKIGMLNHHLWGDLEAVEGMRWGMGLHVKRVVHQAQKGQYNNKFQGQIGRIFWQFRTFMLSAIEGQLLSGVQGMAHGDKKAAVAMLTNSLFGGLSYVASVYSRYGLDEEKRKEYLALNEIAKGMLFRSGWFTMGAPIIDTTMKFTGHNPIFSHGRSSGMTSDFLMGSPAIAVSNATAGAVKSLIAPVLNPEYKFSQADWRHWKTIAPLHNIMGVPMVLDQVGKSLNLPKSSKSKKKDE